MGKGGSSWTRKHLFGFRGPAWAGEVHQESGSAYIGLEPQWVSKSYHGFGKAIINKKRLHGRATMDYRGYHGLRRATMG